MHKRARTLAFSILLAASANAHGGTLGGNNLPCDRWGPVPTVAVEVFTVESDFGQEAANLGTVTTINFDDLPAGTQLCSQYLPVLDIGNTGRTYAAGPPSNCGGTYHSSPNVLFNYANGPSLTPSPIVIHFMTPVTAVGFWNTSQKDAVRVKFYGICNDLLADAIMPDESSTCQENFLGVISTVFPIYRMEAVDASPYNSGFDTFFLDDLSYVLAGTTDNFEPFCFGTNCNCPCVGPIDIIGTSGFPIRNGAIGGGCDNSGLTGGARLCGSGIPIPGPSTDTVVIEAWGGLPGRSVLLFQSKLNSASAFFGDGATCLAGSLTRIGTKTFDNDGYAAWGLDNGSLISVQSAALSDPILLGSTRYYQATYRDGHQTFCTSPPNMHPYFNLSNAIAVIWN